MWLRGDRAVHGSGTATLPAKVQQINKLGGKRLTPSHYGSHGTG
ncbi:hypothetical protein [Actinomadura barringtoniae]|nr:hypothetical protein [Actinomadura barringtoniae]